MNRYIPRLRPASFATLPQGLSWSYVESPGQYGLANRPDLPTSRHPYGVIETSRKLTCDELQAFDLEAAP